MGIGVEDEEGRCHLSGTLGLVVAVAAHVPLTVAAHTVGIDGQQPSLEVAGGSANFAQGDLEALTVNHRSSTRRS